MSSLHARPIWASRQPSALISLLAATISLSFLAPNVHAQTLLDHMWETDGFVTSLATSGRTVYLGGDFTYVGPRTGGLVGTDPTTGAVLPTFPSIPGARVVASVPDGAGGWYVAGEFASYGAASSQGLRHIRADLSLDPWTPDIGAVDVLALSSTTLYVGGRFSFANGEARERAAAFDVSTGQLTAWNPDPYMGYPGEGMVMSLAVSGSNVYIGGWFDHCGGESRQGVAAVDATTGLATAWNPNASENGTFSRIIPHGTTVYLGGSFESIGGEEHRNLVEVEAVSGLATSWDPQAGDGEVLALASDGSTLYVGGYFENLAGEPRPRIGAFDMASGLLKPWNPEASDGVRTLSVSGSVVYVGGDFKTIGGQSRRGMAALDASTGLATAWDPYPASGALTIEAGENAILVGGDFNSIGGVSRNYFAAIDSATGRVTDWDPGINAAGAPWGTKVAISESGTTVYIGGPFTIAGGQPRAGLAEIDAVTGLATAWTPPPVGWTEGFLIINKIVAAGSAVYVAGAFSSMDGSPRTELAALDAATGALLPWNPAPESDYSVWVSTLAKQGTTLYVGGHFSRMAGQPRSGAAAFDVVTGALTAWHPDIDGYVYAIASSGPTVYVGGGFTRVSGQSRSNLAAMDAASGLATDWTADMNGPVSSIALGRERIFVAGSCTPVGGEPWGPRDLVAFDRRTGGLTQWAPLPYTLGLIEILARGDRLYVGGGFSIMAGVPCTNFAAFREDSSAEVLDVVAPVVNVLAPNGRDELAIGAATDLQWVATDSVGVTRVTLYLSRAGAAGPWELLGNNVPRTGHFTWFVTGPECLLTGYLRVDASDAAGNIGTDISDQPFTIMSAPVPTLVELFRVVPTAQGVRIEWRFADPASVRDVELQRARDAAGEWTRVSIPPQNNGTLVSVLDAEAPGGAPAWYRLSGVQRDGRAFTTPSVSVDALEPITTFALTSPAPNPTAGRALVSFALPRSAHVRVSLADVQGREVALLAEGMREAGRYNAALDARDLSAGLYFVRMQAGGITLTRRLILVR